MHELSQKGILGIDMQKFVFLLWLIIVVCGIAAPTTAMPMLSADNSLLTGVEVNGNLYDVSFADGAIRDFYPVADVLTPGWSDFSISMIAAIVDALNSQGRTVAAPDIPGCRSHPGLPEFGIGPDYCFLYIPSYYFTSDASYQIGHVATATPNGAISYSAQIYGWADLYGNTMGSGMFAPDEWVTLARISPASSTVPGPATFILVLIALAGLGISRSQFRLERFIG